MSTNILAVVLTAVSSYLLGSLSFAVIVSRLYAKDDVRKYGSGNAGMTNVLRVYGKLPAFFTLLGDFSKGALAVLIGRQIFALMGVTFGDAGYIAGIFALLGHLFPLFFGFKGGKGVLTCAGIIFIVSPVTFLLLVVIVVPIMFLTKMVSVGSITAAVLYPILTFMVLNFQHRPVVYDTLCAAGFGVIVLFMHRENIKRLLKGTENRFGSSKK